MRYRQDTAVWMETEANMAKIIKWIVIELIIFAVFITGSVILVTRYIQPYMLARTNMPKDGGFVFRQLDDGMLEISWSEADRADYYIFQVYQLPNGGTMSYQNEAGKLVYEKKVTEGTSVILQSDAYSGNMLFRVSSAVGYVLEQSQRVRLSDKVLEVITKFEAPAIDKVTCTAETGKQTAYIRFETTDATSCHVSVVNAAGEKQFLKTVSGNALTLNFGQDGDLPVPAFGEKVDLYFSVTRETEGVTYYSTDFATLSIDRAMLVPSDILLEYACDEQSCWLNWQEEDCDFYEIQVLDPATGVWSVRDTVNAEEDRTYLMTDLQEDVLLVLRVTAAYEKETKGPDGEPQTIIKYRSISNEIGVNPSQFEPQRTQINVNNIWNDADDQDGLRPDSITINLLANGDKIAEIILSEQTGWSYTFEDLLVYSNGQKIEYTVTGDPVSDYTAEITGNATDGFTLTNTHVAKPKSWMGTVTIYNLRIRAGTGYNYAIVDHYQKGDRVEILEIVRVGTELWGRVDKGWVSMGYVLLEDVHQTVTVLINNLRIRADTGYNYNILGYLQMGDQVEILETKLVGDVLWGRIDQGWISLDEQYVKVNPVMP